MFLCIRFVYFCKNLTGMPFQKKYVMDYAISVFKKEIQN